MREELPVWQRVMDHRNFRFLAVLAVVVFTILMAAILIEDAIRGSCT